ncbi:glycoside hydrolase family 36 protein [Sinomonas sp. JGH33]|uniref:Glycoside hydrolase family 36 protein n=1 Tax=Sinomonas terricola TaxID=3110330 RepID=A0ABU5T6D7_9MICC|nr:glycoside hydrolase family 36 protein [Sinomonas sp. JGH33]MEA5455237.1 glycoside hydrolase family 36 protein [Sinomonas sp. JGH33]
MTVFDERVALADDAGDVSTANRGGDEAGQPAPLLAEVHWSAEQPLSLVSLDGVGLLGRHGVPLVEVFTAREQRARTSQAYVRSAVGARLRVKSIAAADDPGVRRLIVDQHDEISGLSVKTTLSRPVGINAMRVETLLCNTSDQPLTVTAIATSFGIARTERLDGILLGTAASEWLGENRWRERPLAGVLPYLDLALHDQDARGHHSITSHGGWSSGEHLPAGYLLDGRSGEAVAWQVETSAGWHMDFSGTREGAVLSLLGPADLEHHFAHRLAPGATFEAVPVAIAVSEYGRDDALGQLTAYRRWLRDEDPRGDDLPVIYNDFMNTLMGQPTTEALLPLIREAAAAGAEVFCIDAGWFADPEIGDWWDTIGEWTEAPGRFTGGLRAVIDEIHRLGMRSGIWLEPEIVGARSPLAGELPEEGFFQRFGQRVREHDRYHLDLRHPAVRSHLDRVIDRLVADLGVSYFKFDYNINPGAGTEWRAAGAGDGLLAHTRALRDWLAGIGERHPQVLIENCSSGAMRADYSLLSVTHLQSTSDQQDFRLYPPIAASAPAHVVPEQCGNWAYPAADMTPEETAFTLVTGLSGRLYLSGFLDELSPAQRALVHEAVAVHRRDRHLLRSAIPFWPLGLPAWNDPVVCLGLRHTDATTLYIWDRGADPAELLIPGVRGTVSISYPSHAPAWSMDSRPDGLAVRTLPGLTARVITVAGEI